MEKIFNAIERDFNEFNGEIDKFIENLLKINCELKILGQKQKT